MTGNAQVVGISRRNHTGTTLEPVAVSDPLTPLKGVGVGTTGQFTPSRYVKRCVRCRQVRGNSSFTGKPGYRGDVCRHCADIAAARTKHLRGRVRRLARLTVQADELAERLEGLRREIRKLELEMIYEEQPDLLEETT